MTRYSADFGGVLGYLALSVCCICTCTWPLGLLCVYCSPSAIAERRDERPVKVCKRQRRLSLSLEKEKRWKRGQVTYEQEGSLFFRLPTELRVLVYEAYFGREIRTVWDEQNGRVRALRGSGEELGGVSVIEEEKGVAVDILPLLQTCRRIYSEAIYLLYTSPKYTFTSHLAFLTFSWNILPDRFNSIRRLHLDLGREEVKYCLVPHSTNPNMTHGPPFGDFRWHPLNMGMHNRFLHKGVARYHNTALVPVLNIKHADSPNTYLNTVAAVVSRMKSLLDLKIVIRTVNLKSWTSDEHRLFANLGSIETMQVAEGSTIRLDIIEMRWKNYLGMYVDNDCTISEARASWKVDRDAPFQVEKCWPWVQVWEDEEGEF